MFKLIVRDYNFFKKIFNPFSEEEINILLKDILGEKFKIYSKVLEFKKKIFEIFPELKSEEKNFKSIIFSSIRYTNLHYNDKSIYNRVIQSEIFSNYNRLDLITEKYNQFTKRQIIIWILFYQLLIN